MAYDAKRHTAEKSDEAPSPVDFTQTPAFQEAVAAAAKAAVEAALTAHPGAPPSNAADGMQKIFDRLAKSIDDLTNQDSRRIHVAPAVLAHRNAERVRMGELILARREAILAAENEGRNSPDEWPLYRVLDMVYLNDRKIDPYQRGPKGDVTATVIQYDGVPNSYMFPLNSHAEAIHGAFVGSIGSTDNPAGIGPAPLWLSHNGLVVRGDPPSASRARLGLANGTEMTDAKLDVRNFQNKLGVVGAIDPGAEFVHILGTLAAPARQNYRGSDGPRPTHKLAGTA